MVAIDDVNATSDTAAFEIVATMVVLGCVIEFLSWLVCYRTSEYQRMTVEVEAVSKKLESMRESGGKDSDKKIKKMEESLKKASGQMFWLNARVLALNVVAMFCAYRYMSSTYKGIVVAKLPFVPLSFFTRITHAGLKGTNFTECSGTFIYVMCQSAVRPTIQKLIGLGPSRQLVKQTSLQSIAEKQMKQQ